MKASTLCASLLVTAMASHAQFIKGNEAVQVMPDGSKRFETPPLLARSTGQLRVCAATAGCHPGPWYMVETQQGLQECTEPFARATSCRGSTYGDKKLSRVWMVKRENSWLWCQYPDIAGKCVDMHAKPPLNLPVSAVQ